MCKTAFDLYQALYDRANDYWPENVLDVQYYAENVFDIQVRTSTAMEILGAHRCLEMGEQGSDNFYRIIQEPLEQIIL